MKKLLNVSAVAFIFLEASSLFSYFVPNSVWDNPKIPLAIGIALLVTSGLFALSGNRSKNKILSFLPLVLNSFALGFCIEAWYVFRGFNNSLSVMTLVSLGAVGILWIYAFLFRIFGIQEDYKPFAIAFIAACSVLYAFAVISSETTWLSTLGWYLVMSTGFVLVLSRKSGDKFELIENLANSTFTVVFVAIIIACLLSVGEGDIDLPIELPFGSKESNKKKNDINDY